MTTYVNKTRNVNKASKATFALKPSLMYVCVTCEHLVDHQTYRANHNKLGKYVLAVVNLSKL